MGRRQTQVESGQQPRQEETQELKLMTETEATKTNIHLPKKKPSPDKMDPDFREV